MKRSESAKRDAEGQVHRYAGARPLRPNEEEQQRQRQRRLSSSRKRRRRQAALQILTVEGVPLLGGGGGGVGGVRDGQRSEEPTEEIGEWIDTDAIETDDHKSFASSVNQSLKILLCEHFVD